MSSESSDGGDVELIERSKDSNISKTNGGKSKKAKDEKRANK